MLVRKTFLTRCLRARLYHYTYVETNGGIVQFQANPVHFLSVAEDFLHDGFSIHLNYLALQTTENTVRLVGLTVTAGPRPVSETTNFSLRGPLVFAGQRNLNNQTASQVLALLEEVSRGSLTVDGSTYIFQPGQFAYWTELEDSDRWDYDAHLRVESRYPLGTEYYLPSLDRALRIGEIPFDGVTDLALALGLPDPCITGFVPIAEIRVRPPIDCLVDQTSLSDDVLLLTMAAHPEINLSLLHVAVRASPGAGIAARQQVSNLIKWRADDPTIKVGTARISLQSADAALVIVSFAGKTIRRQWFADPVKARNLRAAASRYFDADLKQVRRALFDLNDAPKFEQGISSLLFMLGFAPALQVETDAPDILATTPGGQIVLVECTLKTADFQNKVGKLIARLVSLRSFFQKQKHYARIRGVLVCRAPRDQLASVDEESLKQLGVTLVTAGDLEHLVNTVNSPKDPDSYFPDSEESVLSPG